MTGSVLAEEPTSLSSEALAERTVRRRGVDAAIWGVPIVSFDSMRQGYFRDAQAKYNDLIWWPKGTDSKAQALTPNTTLRYIIGFMNTAVDGPVVLDLPAESGGAGFFGTFNDAWWEPIVDLGSVGEDEGKGGKYLVLPPDYKDDVPAGYIPVRSRTNNVFVLPRSIVASNSEADVRAGDDLVKQIRLYPLRQAANPPPQRLIDMTGILYDGLIPYDSGYFTSLARMLNEEPVQVRDLQQMGMLRALGIGKGQAFTPDTPTSDALASAAAEAHAWLMDGLVRVSAIFWPDRTWVFPCPAAGPESRFHWVFDGYFDVDSRAIGLASFFSPPVTFGQGADYVGAFVDSAGQPLSGENSYRLHVPANVPVEQFWSLTIYDRQTWGLFRGSTRVALDSLDENLQKNADGSVDIYIGPEAPAGQESNWLFTPAGKAWWTWFRLYGPTPALHEKTWKLSDIEKVA
jgi:hypothetical protein